jgi:UDP-N-acetylmuramoylalanine--D-glutamate ligase
MNMSSKHVLVLGLGESGLAMALWLARGGARLRVADTRATPDRLAALLAAVPDVEFVSGEFSSALLDDIDTIAKTLLGPNASAKDIGSYESILAALPKERATALQTTLDQDPGWQSYAPK